MALSLSAEGITYVKSQEWDVSVSYRYLHSEKLYVGDMRRPELEAKGPRLTLNSFDVLLTYAFTPRYSATLVMPFLESDASGVQPDGLRHDTSSGGLGDLRLVANAWLFDPPKSPNGNIAVGVGVKAPTGNEGAADAFHTGAGLEYRPVDVSQQLGDGGWGVELELQAFRRILTNTFLYVSGSYLINPREQNSTPASAGTHEQFVSVPDQYQARGGVQQTIWPQKGLALGFGGLINGLPVHDLVGGNYGFRRPGYAVYVEPSINWSHGDWTLNLSVPVALYHTRLQSVPEQEKNLHRAGGFADNLILFSVSKRF